MRSKFSLYRANKAIPDATLGEATATSSPQSTVPRSIQDHGGQARRSSSKENIGSQWWLGKHESAFTELEHKREQIRQETRIDDLSREARHSKPERGPSSSSPSFLDSLPWESSSLTLVGDEEDPSSGGRDGLPHEISAMDTSIRGGSDEGFLQLFGGTMSDLAGRGVRIRFLPCSCVVIILLCCYSQRNVSRIAAGADQR